MDISDMLAPTSDQLDAVDLLGGPRIFTIERATKNAGDDQPLNIHLVGFPRVWRPSKGMRRVLASCWGTNSTPWAGRRVELYCDPEVIFGKEKVGGTRISRLSHIDGPKKVPLLVSRGKSAIFTVTPLPDADPAPVARDWHAEADALDDPAALLALWREAREAPPADREYIAQRGAAVKAAMEAGADS